MANNDWEKAKKIFGDALKLAPGERLRFLDEVCADDTDTRREVESLLNSFDQAESFMPVSVAQPGAIKVPATLKISVAEVMLYEFAFLLNSIVRLALVNPA